MAGIREMLKAQSQGRAGGGADTCALLPSLSINRTDSCRAWDHWERGQSQRGWVWPSSCETREGYLIYRTLLCCRRSWKCIRSRESNFQDGNFCLWPWAQHRENIPALPRAPPCPFPVRNPSPALLLTFWLGKITLNCFHFWCSANDRSRSASSAAEDCVLSLIRSGRAWNPQLVILAWVAESGRYFRWTCELQA